MPARADRREVLRLLEEEAGQLVEVLPQEEFEEEHLEGAVHLPLKTLTAETASVLDQSRPVIVYCWDSL